MKSKLILAALSFLVVVPAFATSMEHPVSWSAGEIIKLLKSPKVMSPLSMKFDPIQSVEVHEEDGRFGWLITTKSCQLFAEVRRELVTRIPGHPFGGIWKETIEVGSCK